jgi:multicomponent Na+:H+ antiporter subunit D
VVAMTESALLLLGTVASSFVTGVAIFFLAEQRVRLRTLLNLAGAIVKLGFIGWMLWGVFDGRTYELRLPLLPGNDLLLRADTLAMLFVTLSAGLWLLTTIYAIGYLEGAPHRSRFFGFFSLCVTATIGIALAGNLVTFFLFYELLTLSTYPLVVHRGTPQALAAGARYLAYTLGGGAALLGGIVWLQALLGSVEFTHGGVASALDAGRHWMLAPIFVLLVAGVGVKAALVPLHAWLPQAMVAPAPVSALLHAVAVVKAGAFGVVRIAYDVYGIEFAADLGLLAPLAAVASVTIVYGSLRALAQDDLKRRLAYSTISQVSYIVLGVALFGPIGSVGGLVHLVHQGIMKITLFFCAGNYAETLGIHKVSETGGVGRRMPWTTAAFTVAALGMIGVPPVAGFISKWYLGLGALDAGMPWVLAVLAASSLLNAAYFLPILRAAWFEPPPAAWPDEHIAASGLRETTWWLLGPAMFAGAASLAVGLLAGLPLSPLDWAQLIVAREYLR